ncbi:hypothetical protein PC115_g21993 [Phytophthora cactorum]|uniref:Uncharacterized protein n=2 Tax=Phytophthora cactorum TaxID=29920 RepID=A0A8T1AMB3_9STRA|nr:hypothetical protein PC115_g21993 [Phytophthora cactorum]
MRPKGMDHGSFKASKSILVPSMAAIAWWDSRPAHFLGTGGSMVVDGVVRRDGLVINTKFHAPM